MPRPLRSAVSLAATAALALGVLSTAVAAPRIGGGEDAHAELTAAGGAAVVSNSREGTAVLGAERLRPGTAVSGTVRIANAGDEAGSFVLEAGNVVDVPGPNGGLLSSRLRLTVTDTTKGRTVYAGPLEFGRVALGRLEAGEARVYALTVAFVDGDNSYQGSSASIDLRWLATTVASEPAPAPRPSPPAPPATPAPSGGPAPPATPAPGGPTTPPTGDPAADEALGLPAANRCIKRGRLKLRLRPPAGVKPRRATVFVNGRRKAVLKGRRLRRALTLRKLPKRATVKVVLDGGGGRVTATRRYRSCASRR
jgi:hypothetical protein